MSKTIEFGRQREPEDLNKKAREEIEEILGRSFLDSKEPQSSYIGDYELSPEVLAQVIQNIVRNQINEILEANGFEEQEPSLFPMRTTIIAEDIFGEMEISIPPFLEKEPRRLSKREKIIFRRCRRKSASSSQKSSYGIYGDD